MNILSKVIKSFKILPNKRSFSITCKLQTEAQTKYKPNLRFREERKEIGAFGWFLLVCYQYLIKLNPLTIIFQSIPAATFALGTWQVQRKTWKENLIKNLKDRSEATPIELPATADEIEKLEYFPVHVRGKFLHDKEIYIGPRSLLVEGDASTKSSLISKGQSTSQGYLVITPLQLSDRKYGNAY